MRKNLLLKLLLFILFSTLLSSFCFAQVTTAWVRRYDGPESGIDEANSMAVDAAGNVYVTGSSGLIDKIGTRLGEDDFATIKYNAFGTEKWIRRYNGGPGSTKDVAIALAVDAAGNVYVTGKGGGNGFTDNDYITIKYDADGNELWVGRYGGTGNDFTIGMAVDALGNVYVTGGQPSYDPSPAHHYDYATVKYDTDGNELWVRTHLRGIPTGIVVDASGNVYVTGGSEGGVTTIKYDTNGNEIWLERFADAYFFAGEIFLKKCIAVDASGNVYIATNFQGILPSPGDHDFMTIKYANDGTLLWNRAYNGPANNSDVNGGLVVDNAGNVYVTGRETGTSDASFSPWDIATIKYNSSGDELWVRKYNGPADEEEKWPSIALDELGNVYIACPSEDVGRNYDYAVIKYNADGIQQWVERYNGPDIEGDVDAFDSYDVPASLTVDARRNVYVTGTSDGAGTHYDYATIKYAQPSPLIVFAGLDLTIFQGYGSLCAALSAKASGGLPPYEYSWIPGQFTTQNIQVCPTKTISYTVTAMDAGKNKATDDVKVNVIDVRCGKNLDKVLVCHKGKEELCISEADVKEHLAHGDTPGACKAPPVPSDNPARPGIPKLNVDVPSKFSVTNYPNPVSATARFQYEIPFDGQVSIRMYDVLGREVVTLVNARRKAGYHSSDFDASSLPNGVYYYKALLHAGEKAFTRSGKIMVIK